MARLHHDVATALLVRRGSVLLCHRHPTRRWYPNVWDVPGGHIEVGETPADAVRRELIEELGVVVHLSSEEPWRLLTPAPDLTVHVWLVEHWSGTVENRAPDEHDQVEWFRPEETEQLDLADKFLAELIQAATTS